MSNGKKERPDRGVRICGEYDLTVNNSCYVLGKARTGKDGSIRYDHCTYYASLSSALTRAMDYAVRDGVEQGKLTEMRQVLAEIRRAEAEVKCAVEMLELKLTLEKASQTQNAPPGRKCA